MKGGGLSFLSGVEWFIFLKKVTMKIIKKCLSKNLKKELAKILKGRDQK